MLKKRPEPAYNQVINLEAPHQAPTSQEIQRRSSFPPVSQNPNSNSTNPNASSLITVDRNRDLEGEEQIRAFTTELTSATNFVDRKLVINRLFRRSQCTKRSGQIHRFLVYNLLIEYSHATIYQHKNFALSKLRHALDFCTPLEFDFKKTLIETLMLHLEIEANHDLIVLILNILGVLIDQTHVDDFMKYQLIEILHSKLWEEC